MKYNAWSEYGRLLKNAETNTEKYRKLGMSEQAIEAINEFDRDVYNSDRKFYAHLAENTDKTAEELADEIPCHDTYFADASYSLECIEDKRLKRIIQNADENEKKFLILVIKGYSNTEISRILKISKSGISKMICKMKRNVN